MDFFSKRITVFIATVFLGCPVVATPPSLSYQGRIIGTNGRPLEYENVAFEFIITSPDGSCILYREQKNGVDMRNSGGVFDSPIGLGTKSYPTTSSPGLLDVFSNKNMLSCQGGATYQPGAQDGRRLRVQFHDGLGWKLISPDNIIRSVPYAAFSFAAESATRLGNHTATDFILKNNLPTLPCANNEVLSFDGSAFLCVIDQGGSGVISGVSGSGPITVTGSGNVTIGATVGTTSGTLAAGNDSRFTDARTPTGSAGGDLGNTYPNPKVVKLQGADLSNAVPNGGDFLKFVGSVWTPSTLAISDITGLSTYLNGTVLQSQFPASCTAAETLTWISPSGSFSCTPISITGSAFAAQAAGTVFAGPTSGSASPTFRALQASDLPSSITDAAWMSAGGNVSRSSGNVGIGTTSPTSQFHLYKPVTTGIISSTGVTVSGSGTNFTSSLNVGDQIIAGGQLKTIVAIDNDTGLTVDSAFSPDVAGTDFRRVGALFDNGSIAIGNMIVPTLASLSVNESDVNKLATLVKGFSVWGATSTNNRGTAVVSVSNTITGPTSRRALFGNNLLYDASVVGGTHEGYAKRAPSIAGSGIAFSGPNSADGTIEFLRTDDTNDDNWTLKTSMVISSSGKVGIGTSNPVYTLDVAGSINASSLYLNGVPLSNTGTSSSIPSTGGSVSTITQTNTDAASATRAALTIKNQGTGADFEYNLIGENAAGAMTSSISQGGAAYFATSVQSPVLTGSSVYGGNLTLESTSHATKGNIFLAPNGNNVAIGSTNPLSRLHVQGADTTVYTASSITEPHPVGVATTIRNEASKTGAGAFLRFLAHNDSSTYQSAYLGAVSNSGGSIPEVVIGTRTLSNAYQERMRIKSNGNVGIGTPSPLRSLHIETPSGRMGVFKDDSAGAQVAEEVLGRLDFGLEAGANRQNVASVAAISETSITTGSGLNHMVSGALGFYTFPTTSNLTSDTAVPVERMRINRNGNVGIGTAAPAHILDIQGGTSNAKIQLTTDYVNTTPGLYVNNLSPNANAGGRVSFQTAGTERAYMAYQLGTGTTPSLQFGTAGSERLRIDSSGNVGIGTANPASKLHVLNSSTDINSGYPTWMFSELELTHTAASSTQHRALGGTLRYNSTQASTGASVASYGYVEHKSTGAADSLVGMEGQVNISGSSGSAGTIVNATGISGLVKPGWGQITNAYGGSFRIIGTNNTNAYGVHIGAIGGSNKWSLYASDSAAPSYFAGKVGIGTASPTLKTEIYGAGEAEVQKLRITEGQAGGESMSLGAGTSASTILFSNTGDFLLKGVADVTANPSGVPNMIVQGSTGNVGIGTASPDNLLDVVSANADATPLEVSCASGYCQQAISSSGIRAVMGVRQTNSDGFIGTNSNHKFAFRTNALDRAVIDASGNFGIGTTAPTTTLQVNGVISPSTDNVRTLGTAALRFTTVYATTGTINTSDARQKRDVVDSDLGLDFIGKLRPVSYRWIKGADSQQHYGLIAQEAERAILEAKGGRAPAHDNAIVDYDPENDRYGMRYHELIAPIIKALQELLGKFTGLEQSQAQQSREMASLKAEISAKDRQIGELKTEIEKQKRENAAIQSWICKKDPEFCLKSHGDDF